MYWLAQDQLVGPVRSVLENRVWRDAQQVVERGGKVGLRAW